MERRLSVGIKIQSFPRDVCGEPESWHDSIERRFSHVAFRLDPVEDGGVFLQTAALLSVLPGDTPQKSAVLATRTTPLKDSRPVRATLSEPAALQATNGYKHVGPLEHINQLLKDAFVIVRSGFQVFFEDALRVAHGLKC